MKPDFNVSRTSIASLIIVLLSGCLAPPEIEEHRAFIASEVVNSPAIQGGLIAQENFELYYRATGSAEMAVAVWVHGTPGGWASGGRLLVNEEFTRQVLFASIDRPGWGRSQFIDAPQLVTSYAEQAKLIVPLLKKLKADNPGKPLILVGHSLGGSIIPVIAADFPELVNGLLIVSAGLDPELTLPRWYNRVARNRLINGAIGERMQAANVEMYSLAPELEKLSRRWTELKMPIIVVQGDEDELVNPANADYAERVLNPEYSRIVRLPNQGHFTHVERTDLIATCILAIANQQLDRCVE
ncbi:MAG: alpha/beta hydrolase [Proteobacteria bacterium]|jgi:pimeloyl-ACP methyl ester carboxylesterase|nr:alpha/beta hydrolase [Pseudomonadota bacterium]